MCGKCFHLMHKWPVTWEMLPFDDVIMKSYWIMDTINFWLEFQSISIWNFRNIFVTTDRFYLVPNSLQSTLSNSLHTQIDTLKLPWIKVIASILVIDLNQPDNHTLMFPYRHKKGIWFDEWSFSYPVVVGSGPVKCWCKYLHPHHFYSEQMG